jgi:hypothetical protein
LDRGLFVGNALPQQNGHDGHSNRDAKQPCNLKLGNHLFYLILDLLRSASAEPYESKEKNAHHDYGDPRQETDRSLQYTDSRAKISKH